VLLDDGFALDPDLVLLGVFPANDFGDLWKNDLVRSDTEGRFGWNEQNPVAERLRGSRLGMLYRRAVRGAFFAEDEQDILVELLFGDGYDLLRDLTTPKAREQVARMRVVLAEFKRVCAEREIAFGVVIIPSYENIQNDANFRRMRVPRSLYFRNEQVVAELCGELELRCVDLSGPFHANRAAGLYSDHDRHTSARGHDLGARVVAEAFGPRDTP
jgi:hypothetical protein